MTAETMNDAVDQVVDQLPRKKMSGKKLVLLVVLPLLVLGGGAGALYATGVIDKLLGGGAEEDGAAAEASAPAEPVGPGVFYDLPDMLVNLNTTANRQHFLKISVSLEVGSEEDVAAIEEVMPRIIDNFQVYLRELTLDDLRGSAGLYRLREELLRRVDTAAGDATVRDVLFREMLVQ
ncbi:MAG: flagellar basal body protein FliL [Alphaproteobacteria bacterium]|jgi:flagellar FliL protein|nr:flagellar basal body protein FliL [Alphaproteobacteria bacterium]